MSHRPLFRISLQDFIIFDFRLANGSLHDRRVGALKEVGAQGWESRVLGGRGNKMGGRGLRARPHEGMIMHPARIAWCGLMPGQGAAHPTPNTTITIALCTGCAGQDHAQQDSAPAQASA